MLSFIVELGGRDEPAESSETPTRLHRRIPYLSLAERVQCPKSIVVFGADLESIIRNHYTIAYIRDYITTSAWFDGEEDVCFVGSDEVILLRVFYNVNQVKERNPIIRTLAYNPTPRPTLMILSQRRRDFLDLPLLGDRVIAISLLSILRTLTIPFKS